MNIALICYQCKKPIAEAEDGQIIRMTPSVQFHPDCWHEYSKPEREILNRRK